MKKTYIALTLAAILVIAFGVSVFAEANVTNTPQWFKDMITWKKDQIKQAVISGKLTEEQAKLYYDRIEQMEKFHIENGFTNMMGNGSGSCHGASSNKGSLQNNNSGFGQGMMRGRL